MTITILIDVDGVLADFSGHYLNTMHRLTGVSALASQIVRWNIHEHDWFPKYAKRAIEDEIAKQGWCDAIPVLPHAANLIRDLQALGTIYAITSPWASAPHWMHERTEWLHKKLGIRSSHVVHTQTKHIVSGDVLIDDKPEHVEDWALAHPHGRGILFSAPHNRSHQISRGVRATTGEDVIAAVVEFTKLRREIELSRPA